MPQPTTWVVLSLALATTTVTSAFTPTLLPPKGVISYSANAAQRPRENRRLLSMASTDDEDCGCGGATVSGRPSDAAKAMDPRVAIGKSTFLTLDGEETSMNQLLGEPRNSGTSLVVFLRSLG